MARSTIACRSVSSGSGSVLDARTSRTDSDTQTPGIPTGINPRAAPLPSAARHSSTFRRSRVSRSNEALEDVVREQEAARCQREAAVRALAHEAGGDELVDRVRPVGARRRAELRGEVGRREAARGAEREERRLAARGGGV